MKKLVFLLVVMIAACCPKKEKVFVPTVDGEWWTVALNPDLGKYTSEQQEPVDFGIWQAADGTWQIWSCIRNTNCGGYTRLFHGWEGKNLTDTNWKPLGITMESDTLLGEVKGGLQAPFVIKEKDLFYMFYGDWNNICLAQSNDGKKFTRVLNSKGTASIFTGPMRGTRDPMVLKIKEKFYCYYSGHLQMNDTNKIKAAMFCRTSDDLKTWGEPIMVSGGGMVAELDGWGGGDAECPFIVPLEDKYVLFRNQIYGYYNLNTQYCSNDPLDFGIDDNSKVVQQLPVAAPEIVKSGDQYYIVALLPSLKGIRIAKLKFEQKTNL